MLKNFNVEGILTNEKAYSVLDEDETLFAILNKRRDPKIDQFIELLQRGFAKTTMWGQFGGEIGEQMVRAAFAPIIKFSHLEKDFAALA